MSPIRLIIIGILLYIGYLLFKGSGGKKKEEKEINGPSDGSETSDILVECPECKKLVPKGQAIVLEEGDENKYFCSKECCETFVSQKGDN